MPGKFSLLQKAASYVGGVSKSVGNIAKYAAMGRAGGRAQAALLGGGAGGLYGAMSSDTSVIGGAAMGAGAGVAAARYGGAGMKALARSGRSGRMPSWPTTQRAMRAGRAIGGQMKGDALLASNKAVNGFNALKSRMGY